MRANLVYESGTAAVREDLRVMIDDLEVLCRAKLIAEMARERDASYPAWEDLPAHTQRDLIETARKGFEQEGAKDRIRSMIGSGLREKWL
jgi:hypothetical protein